MVSIVITAYNVEAYIEQAIRSCLQQTYRDIEIVVVEDCSTDGTLEVVEGLAKSDERIRIVRNEVNCGAGKSRKIGIASTKAEDNEYVLLLDGDDWLNTDFVEALAKRAEETGADIVSGGITVRKEDGSYDITSYGDCMTEGDDKVTKFWGERVVFMNNKLIRRSLHNRVPYSERRYIEDTQVIIPQLYFANKVAYVDCVGYNYRMQQSSLTHTASPFKTCLFRLLCAQDIIRFFNEHDKEYINRSNIGASYARELQLMKNMKPTREMIEEFKDDWVEMTMNLINNA